MSRLDAARAAYKREQDAPRVTGEPMVTWHTSAGPIRVPARIDAVTSDLLDAKTEAANRSRAADEREAIERGVIDLGEVD